MLTMGPPLKMGGNAWQYRSGTSIVLRGRLGLEGRQLRRLAQPSEHDQRRGAAPA